MEHWIFGALLTFLAGAAVSFLNYCISRTVMRKKPDAYPMTTVVRQITNVAYLAAVYFITPYTPWGLVPLLIGAALGSTLPMFCFTYLLVKEGGKGQGGTENSNSDKK